MKLYFNIQLCTRQRLKGGHSQGSVNDNNKRSFDKERNTKRRQLGFKNLTMGETVYNAK